LAYFIGDPPGVG